MKRAIICYNCQKFKKESESYLVKVEITEKNLETLKENQYEIKTKICRGCAKKMGYKVKARL